MADALTRTGDQPSLARLQAVTWMIVIGLIANRLSHDESDYFLGGRRLGPWVAGLSASASSSGENPTTRRRSSRFNRYQSQPQPIQKIANPIAIRTKVSLFTS